MTDSKISSSLSKFELIKNKNYFEQENVSRDSNVLVQNKKVMEYVLDVLHIIGKHAEVTITARGDLIPTTVTISLIVTEKMLKRNSKVQKITPLTVNPSII